MTETKTHPHLRSISTHKGLAIASLVVGLVGIVLGPIGIVTGLVAIVFAIIVLAKGIPEKGFAIGGLISGIASVIFGIAMTLFIGYIFASGVTFLDSFSKQSPVMSDLIAAKKDFVEGETATVYTIDYTVVQSQRHYVLDQKQTDACVPEAMVGDAVEMANVDYVYVKATYKSNSTPRVETVSNKYSIEDNFRIDHARPCYTDIGKVVDGLRTIEYVYRVDKATSPLVLSNVVSVYTTSLNSFVGSEGAPSEDLVYNITLKAE